MKRFLCFALSLCIAMVACTGVAFAESTSSVSVNFRSDDGYLSISGKMGESYGTLVFAVITKSEKAAINLSGANVVCDTVYTADGGTVETEISLPNTMENGKYYVYLFSKDAEASDSFMYTNEGNMKALILTVNGIASKEDMYTLVSGADNPFAVDTDKLGSYLQKISYAFYEVKGNKSYADTDTGAKEMIKDFKTAEAVGQMRSDVKCENVLKAYATYFNADYTAYTNLSDDIRGEINRRLISADYSTASASKIYQSAMVYAKIRYAADWYALKDAVVLYDGTGDLNLTKTTFNNLTDKDKVYRYMFNDRSEMTDIAKIEAKFKEEAGVVYDEENPPQQNNQNGGYHGGGGGGGGSIGVSTEIIDEIQENGSYDEQKTEFSDIDNHWGKTYIETLLNNGIINGFEDKTFKPDALISRAELVKMIVKAFGLNTTSENTHFGDVSQNAWYAEYVAAAYANNVITGDENGNFRPEDAVTRQDAAVMIYRMTKYEDVQNANFHDFDEVSDYAKTASATLCANGIITGNPDGVFLPLASITRAEVAAVLYRVLYR